MTHSLPTIAPPRQRMRRFLQALLVLSAAIVAITPMSDSSSQAQIPLDSVLAPTGATAGAVGVGVHSAAAPASTLTLALIYGTTKGHSKDLCHWIQGKLQGKVKDVAIFNVKDLLEDEKLGKEFDVAPYSALGIITSITGMRYNSEMIEWLTNHAKMLDPKTTAFGHVSGCAGGISPFVRPDLDDSQHEAALKVSTKLSNGLFESLNWRPDRVWYIGGADMNNAPENSVGRWLATKALGWMWGHPPDFTKADQTDYDKLERDVMEWVMSL